MDHQPLDDLTQPEEDRIGPSPVERTGPRPMAALRPRFGLSVPGALAGVLLIGTMAFGANLAGHTFTDGAETEAPTDTVAVEPTTESNATEPTDAPPATGDDGAAQDPAAQPGSEDESEATEPTDKPEATDKPKPTAKPKPKPTDKPKPTAKPEPKPTAKPVLSLSLSTGEGAVLVDWGACEVDGADYYKVVRSTDSTVKWPTGDRDTLITAVEIGGKTKAWDEGATPGKKAWYRVFCVRHTDDGYKVLAASGVKSIVAPDKPDPKPEPTEMGIEAGVDGGAVVLHWEACGSEDFNHYRIIRKVNGAASVIAEIEDASTTTYMDDSVEPGVTYRYLVQAKGHVGDEWFLLGTTDWVSVTVE